MPSENGHVSIQLVDALPVTTSIMNVFQTSTGLLADSIAAAQALLPLVDAVTQSRIAKCDLVYPIALPGGLKSSAVAFSRNSDAALLDFALTGEFVKFSESFPNWIPAGFLVGHESIVDDTQTDVAALIAYLQGSAHSTIWTNEQVIQIAGYLRGTYSTRKHRRAVARAK
jgi:hypothetical protein